jgi:hypothetical protein
MMVCALGMSAERSMAMTREELVAVRDVIDALLKCPDDVRELLTQWIAPQARWLAPEARPKGRTVPLIFSKPNGLDPHPPPMPSVSDSSGALGRIARERTEAPLRRSPTPYTGKARRGRSPLSGKAAERRLLEAMRESPGLSVVALAKAASAGRSAAGERLRQLAARGAIEKDADGRWRIAGEAARRMEASPT